MNWNELSDINQLNLINEESKLQSILIFKHSTRCSISDAAFGRLERKWKDDFSPMLKPYYLDLIKHRDISNEIASRYNIEHQSPQVLIIKNGACIYSKTHMEINLDEIMTHK